jgi:hypothetical protein
MMVRALSSRCRSRRRRWLGVRTAEMVISCQLELNPKQAMYSTSQHPKQAYIKGNMSFPYEVAEYLAAL